MNLFKRLAALLLAAVLVICQIPVQALAGEQETLTFETTYINPYYTDFISPEDLRPAITSGQQTYESANYVSTVAEAAEVLKPHLIDRDDSAVVYIVLDELDQEIFNALVDEILAAAYAHTGVPNEGDYIRWNFSGCNAKVTGNTIDDLIYAQITFSLTHITTADQEAAVDEAVEDLLSQLNLSKRSDYDKVKAVYDYICANIAYDEDESDDTLKHSTYAALIKKTAVCQGYASLLYRLLLELDVDCRFIGGSGNGDGHGWNIVELDNLYYNADSTWDAGRSTYVWFLKCPDNFANHTRYEEFDTAAFHSEYPMGSADYVPHEHSYSEETTEPTCTEAGYTTYTCECGDYYVSDEVDALGHAYGEWYETKAATTDETGEERRDCENCDAYETRETEKLNVSNPSGTCGDNLTWVFDEATGVLTISGIGAMTDYSEMPWNAFTEAVTALIIEDGVTALADCAFMGCVNLKSVELSDTMEVVHQDAFNGCTSLQEINIPVSVSAIRSNAFNGCTNLKTVEFPDAVDSLGLGIAAFIDCTSLEVVKLPAGTTYIDCGAFCGCSNLSSVSIPASVEWIEVSAFRDCPKLTEITFEHTSQDELTLDSGIFHFTSNPDEKVITTISVPDNTDIHTAITTHPWNDAYRTIIYRDESDGTLSGECGDNLTWTLEDGVLTISGAGDMEERPWITYKDSIKTVIVEMGVTSIYSGAFEKCTNLDSVTLPESVTLIEVSAFSGCSSLASIIIPNSVTVIELSAFLSCTSLHSISIPASVTFIDPDAFMGCDNLTGIWVDEENVNYANDSYGVLFNKDMTELVKYPEGLSGAYVIPNGVTTIGSDAFIGSQNLTGITMPDTVTEIFGSAFMGCNQLKNLVIPGGVTKIEGMAFAYNDNLESITFEGDAPSLADSTFAETTTTAYYPFDNSSWNDVAGQNYGGTITWIAYCDGEHSWDEGTVTKEPTETETGIRTYTCKNCGETKTEDIPALDHHHSYVAVVTDPTCTEAGYTTYTCECGDTYIGDEVEALGHTEVIDEAVAATCTTTGLTEGTHCSVCEEVLVAQAETPTVDHAWDEGTVTKEPTESETGIRTYTCERCSETKTEEIPCEPTKNSSVQRIAGENRIETALSVAAALKDALNVEKFDTIILAAGGSGKDQTKFADALSGSYLASTKKAPILLYTQGDLSEKNLAFIEENLNDNGTIYLLGGNVSIPVEVEEALTTAGYNTKRLGGDTRYETNLVILKEAGIETAEEILIAGGQAFADSLSASATGLPVMLVKGTGTVLNDAQIEFLKGLNGKKVTILGGSAAISAELEAAIEEAVGTDVERVFGETREHTSVMVAEKYFADADFALVTYSMMYPDGLAGGVLANVLGAPLLLTRSDKEAIANEYITQAGIESGYVLGGTAVLSDETARLVFGLVEDADINAA